MLSTNVNLLVSISILSHVSEPTLGLVHSRELSYALTKMEVNETAKPAPALSFGVGEETKLIQSCQMMTERSRARAVQHYGLRLKFILSEESASLTI